MRPNPVNLLPALLLFAAASGAAAKSTDRKQPMDIAADSSDMLLNDDGVSKICGNVRISQGTLAIDADCAEVTRVKGDLTQVTLTGAPARLRQVNDNGEPMDASAARIIYFTKAAQITLSGGVVIDQPRGSMRGESIRYDLNTGRLNGGGDGSRIQMRLSPKPEGGG